MDSKDKKEIAEIMGKVIDEKVTPKLKRLDEKLDVTMEMVAKNSEDITTLNINIKEIQEDVSDSNFTAQRIESKLNMISNDQDSQDLKTRQLNRRTLRLETKVKKI